LTEADRQSGQKACIAVAVGVSGVGKTTIAETLVTALSRPNATMPERQRLARVILG
jgi:Mrp family chromosome partitioning ATPase